MEYRGDPKLSGESLRQFLVFLGKCTPCIIQHIIPSMNDRIKAAACDDLFCSHRLIRCDRIHEFKITLK